MPARENNTVMIKNTDVVCRTYHIACPCCADGLVVTVYERGPGTPRISVMRRFETGPTITARPAPFPKKLRKAIDKLRKVRKK